MLAASCGSGLERRKGPRGGAVATWEAGLRLPPCTIVSMAIVSIEEAGHCRGGYYKVDVLSMAVITMAILTMGCTYCGTCSEEAGAMIVGPWRPMGRPGAVPCL